MVRRYLSLPEPSGTMDGATDADTRDRTEQEVRYGYRKIRVLLNREELERGQVPGVPVVQGRRSGLEETAKTQEESGAASGRALHRDGTEPGREHRLRCRSASGWNAASAALTMLDVYTREAVAIEVRQSLKGDDVVRTLNRMKQERGVPKVLFCDNGSEFTSQAMDLWAYQNGMKIDFSRPGKPTDNAFVESFNGTFRSECLNVHWFMNLKGGKAADRSPGEQEYNESRPHRSLSDRTPNEFASEYAASRILTGT